MIAGVYHSAQSVSDDTCLYLENFAFRVANSSHLDATTKAQVTLGFEYYLGLDGNTTAEDIAGEVRSPSVHGPSRCAEDAPCLNEAVHRLTSPIAGRAVVIGSWPTHTCALRCLCISLQSETREVQAAKPAVGRTFAT